MNISPPLRIQVLQLARGRVSLPELSSLLCCSSEGWGRFFRSHRHRHVQSQQPIPGKYTWPLVVTNSCCCGAMDPDVAPAGSRGQYST